MYRGLYHEISRTRIVGAVPYLLLRTHEERSSSFLFFFSSRRRHTRLQGDWSSDVCSSDLLQRRAGFGDNLVQQRLVQLGLQLAELLADRRFKPGQDLLEFVLVEALVQEDRKSVV